MMVTHPDQELVMQKGKNANIVVRVKCKDDKPAAGVQVEADILKGKKIIELSPASAVTNEDGKAVFIVTGNKKTEEELPEIKFTAGELKAKIAVRVQTTGCAPESIQTEPEKKLVLELGKSGNVTVKVKCETGSPAVDAKVDAVIQEGVNKIELSPGAVLTDAGGYAVFTVTGRNLTEKDPARIKFMVGTLTSAIEVKVAEKIDESPTGKTGKETTENKPRAIVTHPDQELVMQKGKNSNIIVKVKHKDDKPAAGVQIEAEILKGKKIIELSPATAVTDENGKAVFTIAGNKKTEEELPEIKFTAGELKTKIVVRVQGTGCVPESMQTEPEKKLVIELGKSGNVTVKVKCEKGSPAVDAKVDAVIQEGVNKIELTPGAVLTDASGYAVFTVMGRNLTEKNLARIKFTVGTLTSALEVKVAEKTTGEKDEGKKDRKPTTMQTNPSQNLVIEKGKNVNVIVKVTCNDDSPAAGLKIEADVLKGGNAIEISPASAVTDETGKAVFTVVGNKNTDTGTAEVKFSARDLKSKLEVRVQEAECILGSIKIVPGKEMVLEPGKSGTVTVKTKCRNDSPAVDVKVNAVIQEGGNKIAVSPTAALTDGNGNAVFIVTANNPTKKSPAKLRFASGDISAILEVKVKPITEEGKSTETKAQ